MSAKEKSSSSCLVIVAYESNSLWTDHSLTTLTQREESLPTVYIRLTHFILDKTLSNAASKAQKKILQ